MPLTPYSVLFWSCDSNHKRCVLCCVLTPGESPSTVVVSHWMKEPQLIPDKQLQKQVLLVIYHDRGLIIEAPFTLCVLCHNTNMICIIGDE